MITVTATQRKPPSNGKKTLREVRTNFRTLLPFLEANGVGVDREARTARVVIITEGLGNLRDRNYYTESAVESCVKVFDGRQFFIDHPTRSEEEDRPERSIRDLGGYFFGTQRGEVRDPDTGDRLAACFASLRFDESASGQMALDKVATALEYQKRFPNSKDVYAGISINGGGVSHAGTIRGMQVNMVTEIEEAFSADIVTKPARGGRFLALMKEAGVKSAWTSHTTRMGQTRAQMSREGRESMRTAVPRKDAKKTREANKGKDAGKQREAQRTREAAPALKSLKLKSIAKESTRKAVTKRLTVFHEAVQQIGDDEKATPRLMAVAKASLFDLREAGYDVSKMSGKLRSLKAALDAPPDDAGSIASDIKADIDELLAQLGMKPSEPAHDEPMATGEDEADPGDASPGDIMTDEDEAEGEGDENEELGYEHDDAGDMGMGDDEELDDEMGDEELTGEHEEEPLGDDAPLGDEEPEEEPQGEQAMQYKCAKCGEVNQVMPPKGTKVVRSSESDRITQENTALRETTTRLRTQLHAKESRFQSSNGKVSKLVRENVQLRAENTAHRRMSEARKMLKEAQVPYDILSVSDLMALEPHQWATEIKRAKRMLESEARLLHGDPGHGSNADVRRNDKADDAAALAFRESYRRPASTDGDDDE